MPVGWNFFQVRPPTPPLSLQTKRKISSSHLKQTFFSAVCFPEHSTIDSRPKHLSLGCASQSLPEGPQQRCHSEVPFHPAEQSSQPRPVLAGPPVGSAEQLPQPSSLKCWENPLWNYQGSGQLWRTGGYLYGFCWAEPKYKKGHDLLF